MAQRPQHDFEPLERLGAIVLVAVVTSLSFGFTLAGLHALRDLAADVLSRPGQRPLWEMAIGFARSPYFAIVAMALGLALFWTRGRRPITYGISEVAVAVAMMAVSSTEPNANLLQHSLAIAGAVYVFIRGLDNIERGLPSGRTKAIWLRVFPKVRQG